VGVVGSSPIAPTIFFAKMAISPGHRMHRGQH
jgi:hypothetical protein